MSSPEGNYLKIKSSKEIFDEIASRLIDRASGRTTYEKVVPVPEEILALEKWQIDNWIDGRYGCPPGWEANVDEEKGEIVFSTDWRCAQGIIEYLAGMYSVASSKFLSERTSEALIKKLGTLVSEHQRKELRRQVRVVGRARTMNDSTLNILDHIHAAIAANNTLVFKYFHYNINKEREFTRNYKKGGKNKDKSPFYEVSPWALLYDNDNYYLLAYFEDEFRTFRVDRMSAVKTGEQKRQGQEAFEKLDIGAYSRSIFGMFGGKEESVDMVFQNRMIDTVIDKFGKDVFLNRVDDQHFKVTVNVAVSPQFFAWVFGLGNYVTITGPENVVKQMKDMLWKVCKRYEK